MQASISLEQGITLHEMDVVAKIRSVQACLDELRRDLRAAKLTVQSKDLVNSALFRLYPLPSRPAITAGSETGSSATVEEPDPCTPCPSRTSFVNEAEFEGKTTLVVHNVPDRYTQERLLMEWKPDGSYDFLYLPYRFKQRRASRYAFINFTTEEYARQFRKDWDGQRLPGSKHSLSIRVARLQGLAANIELHCGEKDERSRPVVFRNQQRIGFEELLASFRLETSGSDLQAASTYEL